MKDKILEISKKEGLSHIGSCLGAYDIIDEIYKKKKPQDKFVLSCGHAHLAHAIIMGKEKMPAGIHCDIDNGCNVSTGSLGQGLPIALGMAIADKSVEIYCLISDGECAEGSIWESLRIKSELQITNLYIYVNANGYGAYCKIDLDTLEKRLRMFCPDINFIRTNSDFNGCSGVDAHYKKI